MNAVSSFFKILNHPNNRDKKFRTLIKLVWWKINQKLFKYPALIELVEGMKCVCFPNSSFGSLVVYTHLPEYHEMRYFEKQLKENSVFIDVGANIGVYTLLACSKIKRGLVIVFEVAPRALRNLRLNLAINDFAGKVDISKEPGRRLFPENV